MTGAVTEARARAQAAIAHWREARASVNDLNSVPPRLDDLVAVTDRAIAKIGQDIVTEVEALVVELAALRFPVDLDERTGRLESATLALDGALGRLARAASRAGFAEAEHDLQVPPGLRVPVADIAECLNAFVAAVDGIRPVLEDIERRQAVNNDRKDVKQAALVAKLIEKATAKIAIIEVKTSRISLLDVSGVAGLAWQLTQLLRSFVATAKAAATHLSSWLRHTARDRVEPAIAPVDIGNSQLVKRAKVGIRKRAAQQIHGSSIDPPPFSVFRDPLASGGMGPEMVVVPPGEFLMGSPEGQGNSYERPRHHVTIEYSFAIGRFPVTFEEWDLARVRGGVKHDPDDRGWGRGRRPVINVSWADAEAYLAWLSQVTGEKYRLLSEAEWEYACRAGTTTAYAFGNRIGKHQAQFGSGTTANVGSFPPNAWGIYDMHGNVWEWCADRWHGGYRGAPSDGSPWIDIEGGAAGRVVRGGSWDDDARGVRAAGRAGFAPSDRNYGLGFRFARV